MVLNLHHLNVFSTFDLEICNYYTFGVSTVTMLKTPLKRVIVMIIFMYNHIFIYCIFRRRYLMG